MEAITLMRVWTGSPLWVSVSSTAVGSVAAATDAELLGESVSRCSADFSFSAATSSTSCLGTSSGDFSMGSSSALPSGPLNFRATNLVKASYVFHVSHEIGKVAEGVSTGTFDVGHDLLVQLI